MAIRRFSVENQWNLNCRFANIFEIVAELNRNKGRRSRVFIFKILAFKVLKFPVMHSSSILNINFTLRIFIKEDFYFYWLKLIFFQSFLLRKLYSKLFSVFLYLFIVYSGSYR